MSFKLVKSPSHNIRFNKIETAGFESFCSACDNKFLCATNGGITLPAKTVAVSTNVVITRHTLPGHYCKFCWGCEGYKFALSSTSFLGMELKATEITTWNDPSEKNAEMEVTWNTLGHLDTNVISAL